jgi:hypothetical protein
MREHRTLARWCAGLLVAGTVVMGAMAPAEAASTITHPAGHSVHTNDTGWNGT